MKLIITRHGETECNVKEVLAEKEDSLTDNGREQLRKLADCLKKQDIDLIYTSPYERTKESANMIQKEVSGIEIIPDKRLVEKRMGSFLGKGYREVDWSNLPDDVETRAQVQKRAKEFLDEIRTKHKNKTVLVVTHAAVGNAIIRTLRNLDPNTKERIKQHNANLTIFEINKDQIKEICCDNTDHLK